jgi:hypothetical protein
VQISRVRFFMEELCSRRCSDGAGEPVMEWIGRAPEALASLLGSMHNLPRKRWSSPRFAQAPYDPTVPTVFVHIPKTSGMALTRGLGEALAPAKTLLGFDGVMFGGFRDFDSIAPDIRRNIYLGPTTLPPDAGLVAAHMAVSTTTKVYGHAQYVTVLREPHSRVLSHWLFWRSQPADSLAAWGKWAQFLRQARRALSEFLGCRGVACQFDNLSVRMLLWPHRLIPDDDFIASCDDNVLLGEAMARLERFAYVDLVENPDLGKNFESWLGRSFTYPRINEATPVPSQFKTTLHDELTPQALDLLEARGRLDLKLWLAVARERVPHQKAESLRQRILIGSVARDAWLMVA